MRSAGPLAEPLTRRRCRWSAATPTRAAAARRTAQLRRMPAAARQRHRPGRVPASRGSRRSFSPGSRRAPARTARRDRTVPPVRPAPHVLAVARRPAPDDRRRRAMRRSTICSVRVCRMARARGIADARVDRRAARVDGRCDRGCAARPRRHVQRLAQRRAGGGKRGSGGHRLRGPALVERHAARPGRARHATVGRAADPDDRADASRAARPAARLGRRQAQLHFHLARAARRRRRPRASSARCSRPTPTKSSAASSRAPRAIPSTPASSSVR